MEQIFRSIANYCTSKQIFSSKEDSMRTWAEVEFGKDAAWAYEFYRVKGRFPTSKEI